LEETAVNDQFLRSVALFVEFDADELERLSSYLQSSDYQRDQVVLDEGSSNRALHVVHSGRIRVSRRVGERQVSLCDLGEGQTFGELSIIDDGVASACLTALTDTKVLSVSMSDLASFLREKPGAAPKFWRAIAIDLRRRLIQTNEVVRQYFEMNRALAENPKFREAYAMCNR
jgi:CRP-like cAMP-binding protein